MEAPGLPIQPIQIGEDYRGPTDFNHIIGNQLTIKINLKLAPSTGQAAGGM